MSPASPLTFDDIVRAYRKCARGKRKRPDLARFQKRLGQELLYLHRDLVNGSYRPSRSRCFVVEEPRVREIWAADFRDRIVHHLIVEELEKVWLPKFHPKSYACQKGKGLHAALADYKKQIRRVSRGGTRPVWILKLDIESFFFTIHRPTLKELFLRHAKQPWVRELIEMQFDFDPRANYRRTGDFSKIPLVPKGKSWLDKGPEFGIPIGNLTSQFGANLYLNDLDHLITRKLKPEGYLLYMDDLTLIDSSPERLREFAEVVDEWLKTNRRQKLNLSKTRLMPLSKTRFEYLGFDMRESGTSDPLMISATGKRMWRFVREAKRLERMNPAPITDAHPLSLALTHELRRETQVIQSRNGFLKHASARKFRHKTLSRIAEKNPDLAVYLPRVKQAARKKKS